MKASNYRQLNRVVRNYWAPWNPDDADNEITFDDPIAEDAFRQLSRAWIIHVDAAWDTFKYGLKCLLTLRCYVCGYRHLKKPYHKTFSPTHKLTCCYPGYLATVTHFIPQVIGAARHGVD